MSNIIRTTTAPTAIIPAAQAEQAPVKAQKAPAAPKVRKPRLVLPAVGFILSFILPQVAMGAFNPGDSMLLALIFPMVMGFFMNVLSVTFSIWFAVNVYRRLKFTAQSDKVRAAIRTAQQFKK